MEQWYYVINNQRLGPASKEDLLSFIRDAKLGENSFVWKKGFKDWMKVSEVSELQVTLEDDIPLPIDFDWTEVDKNEKNLYLLIGRDRGLPEDTQYGPYNFATVLKLFEDKRITGKTYIWTKGLTNWVVIEEVPLFDKAAKKAVNVDLPPLTESKENRQNPRKPFVARILFRNNKTILEGVCRDISVGGMQVLVDSTPIKVADIIDINVHPENSEYHFVAKGEVARILPGSQGFSFRFKELSVEALTAIKSYLKDKN